VGRREGELDGGGGERVRDRRTRADFDIVVGLTCSYDLEQDKRLSEDTTVLVENYTVRRPRLLLDLVASFSN